MANETFLEELTPDMSIEKFMEYVDTLTNMEDKNALGPEYKYILGRTILHIGIFPPSPSTFTTNQVALMLNQFCFKDDIRKTLNPVRDLDHTQKVIDITAYIVTRLAELGVVEMDEDGNLSTPQKVRELLSSILKELYPTLSA
ncbi:MAG: hypothetical protein AB9915_03435 [Candidatus Dojkabacteria bacterium]